MLRCSDAGAEPTHDHSIPVVIPTREISDMVRTALFAGAAIALAQAWQADVATAATIIERTLPASNEPGSRARQYTIAVPDNLATGAPVPVVMVLHGCLQTQRDMTHDTRS
jgi:poly(3-hydroxybutyrate) depolymerase